MQRLTPALWTELTSVQKEINDRVNYKTDVQLYRSEDFWEVADREGDCEDYALAKRKRLLELGWPASCLRLAICEVPGVGGHAVLTVDTDLGTYAMDNNVKRVVPWRALHYRWLYRQKPGHREWEDISNR